MTRTLRTVNEAEDKSRQTPALSLVSGGDRTTRNRYSRPWRLGRPTRIRSRSCGSLPGVVPDSGRRGSRRLARRPATMRKSIACADVTDDCGARVGADHSRRLTVYRITLAVSLLLQLYCAPVRAGSCPLYLRTRSLRPEDVARPGRSRGCRAATSTTNVSCDGHHVKPKQFLPRLSYKIKLPMLPQICTPQCKALE